MNWATELVGQYGYLAIFLLLMLGIVGPLIPDETILVVAGILIRKGTLNGLGTLAVAYAGSVCGITLSYILGRIGVTALLHKLGAHHLQKTHDFFERYGRWTLFFGYFIVGLRHLTAVVAGTSKLEVPVFAAYAYTGGFFWVLTFLLIGYYIGDGWERWAHYIHEGFGIGAVLVVVIAALVYFFHKRRAR